MSHFNYNHYVKDHAVGKKEEPQAYVKSVDVSHVRKIGEIRSNNYMASFSSEKKMPVVNNQSLVGSRSSKKGFFTCQSSIERR